MSSQVAARNSFLQIERPGGPSGVGVIWWMCLPHGHPWGMSLSIYHFCLFGWNLSSITIAMDVEPAPQEAYSFHRLPERRRLGVMVDFEVLKRVHVCLCNIWSPLCVIVSSICQVCGSRQPRCLGWIQMSLTATQLSSISYCERSWNSFKSLFHNTVVAFDPSWLRSLNNPLLCGLSSFSVFAPYSSLCPQGQPLFKERSFEQFAPSLPHYFTLAHSISPRRTSLGFHYSTSQSSSRYPLCAIIGANSHTARQKMVCTTTIYW